MELEALQAVTYPHDSWIWGDREVQELGRMGCTIRRVEYWTVGPAFSQKAGVSWLISGSVVS